MARHDPHAPGAAKTQSVRPAACGDPALVSSSGGAVKVGVSSEQTLTYTVTVDDNCLLPDPGNVVIALYIASKGYYASEDARFVSSDAAGIQTWAATFAFDPSSTDYNAYWLDSTDYAGTWSAEAIVPGTTGLKYLPAKSAYVQRYSTMSVDASEPTKKGATETVVGKLSRASWDDHLYHGYASQPVQLQWRTLTGSYATLKTVTADQYGGLKTTTTATVDGCYRWVFAGNSTTPAATAVGDCVDVT